MKIIFFYGCKFSYVRKKVDLLTWITYSSSTVIMFLLENSKFSMVLHFLSNQSAIDPSSPLCESLFLVCQTLLSDVSRSCCSTSSTMWNDVFSCLLALCSTHWWARTVTKTLSVSPILVQFSRCWSSSLHCPWLIDIL